MRKFIVLAAVLMLSISGCGQASDSSSADSSIPVTSVEITQPMSYKQISQDEAKALMQEDNGSIIVDVRRQDEYDAGHIPDAILIPNESIVNERPSELPDLDQIILIYCRSGRRSKEASQKLADMGYTNIYEFGGIIDWKGEVVTSEPANW